MGGWLTPRHGRFTPGKETRYPSYRRLGGPQCRPGRLTNILPPPGFEHRTVHPVSSRYTDYDVHINVCTYVNIYRATGVRSFSKTLKTPTQTRGARRVTLQESSVARIHSIRHQHTKLSRPGDLAPGTCAPLYVCMYMYVYIYIYRFFMVAKSRCYFVV